MSGYRFAIFDTAIGPCGIAWGDRGIHAVQLPMGSKEKTRNRIRQRYEWRRRDQAEDAGDRGRDRELHPEPVRLIVPARLQLTASQENPLPWRPIFPVEGEGKCAVQHSVSVSQ